MFFLLAFLEIIVMHHLIVINLGILVGWLIPIVIRVGHGTHTYFMVATQLRASGLVCIKHIKSSMLGGEVSRISNCALRVFNFQYGGMISTP